ncbi:hypothetical protein ASG87_16795 [Frateuria sp. Soil773]|nr:hypothetical protein ASG87_16795 [Frateuria sp. Soil773]
MLRREVEQASDDFFALGGDSISAVRVVSALRQRGYRLSAQKLFELHSVERVALALEVEQASIKQRHVGALPLSPIMHWFFAQSFEQSAHWNQVLDLDAPDLDPAMLKEALSVVIDAHDMLHVRYRQEGGRWLAEVPVDRLPVQLTQIDLDGTGEAEREHAMREALARAQRQLDLEQGILQRALLFTRGGKVTRLCLVLHHLASDVISMGLLTEQLNQVLAALVQSRPVPALDPGASYAAWTQYLHMRLQESDPIVSSVAAVSPASGVPPEDMALENESRQFSTQLEAALVAPVVEAAQQKLNVEMPDLLLACLQSAWLDARGEPAPAISLEAHGRHVPEDAPDVSRTLGWFTTLQTIHADPSADAAIDTTRTLVYVKEARRRHPFAGLDEGLDWLRNGRVPSSSRGVLFNYLGSIDIAANRAMGLLTPRLSDFADLHGPDNHRTHLLDFTASLVDGVLHVLWTYVPRQLSEATLIRLDSAFRRTWSHLGACLAEADQAFTPSDFPELALDSDQLDDLLSVIAEDNP